MIKANFNAYNSYVTDSVYQWDIDHDLVISGLNLSVAPEIHFTNANMDRAIVRQSTLNAGIVTVRIPNSLLQEAITAKAYVGVYEGDTFKVIETIEIPVIAKTKPADYTIEDSDEEIYSFKALENEVANAKKEIADRCEANRVEMVATVEKATEDLEDSVEATTRTLNARVDNIIAHNNDTDGNTELVDMRVGADGRTYASAGEAVRGAINQVAGSVITDVEWTDGYYCHQDGIVTHDAYSCTGYIPLKKDGVFSPIYYRIKVPSHVKICLFTESKLFISSIVLHEEAGSRVCEGFLYPENVDGAYYVVFSSLSDYTYKKVTVCGMGIVDGGVTTEKLADKSVTPEKIAFTTHLKGTNYIDKSKLLIDRFVTTGGAIRTSTGFRLTDYIKLEENTDYYHNGVWSGYYAYYDSEYNLVVAYGNSSTDVLPKPFRIPTGVVYGRFTMTSPENADAAWINTENKQPPEYGLALDGIGINANLEEVKPTDYEGDDICAFTKGVCIGDSLTAGTMNYENESGGTSYISIPKYSFPANLARLTGLEITNKGDSGDTSAEWYETHSGDDLSGHDFAIIQLGVNDSIRYGGWTDTSVQGFTSIINKLKAENKNIKIFVATIMPAVSYGNDSINAVSQGIRDFVTALNDKDVILLDMAIYGHTKESLAYNCGHLSAYGYWRLAKDYKAYISWYMSANPLDFREIQFIGTDYVYGQ